LRGRSPRSNAEHQTVGGHVWLQTLCSTCS
jgi:hypothetical protein